MEQFKSILTFHDSLDKQVHKTSVVNISYKQFPIICPFQDKLLPFQIVLKSHEQTYHFRVYCVNDGSYEEITTSVLDIVTKIGKGQFDVIVYKGDSLFTDDMVNGHYYYISMSVRDNGVDAVYYSNVFKVKF